MKVKRTFVPVLAAVFAASGATALSITVDSDSSMYYLGDLITVTATVVASGGETLDLFQGIAYEISWDPAVAHVDNVGVNSAYGNGTQLVTAGPGVGGSALTATGGAIAGPVNPGCSSNGYSCQFLTQSNANFSTVTLDAQTLVATLVLRADWVGPLDFSQFYYADATGGTLTLGSNLQNACVCMPEPATAALLGFGLLCLGIVRRRARAA